MMTTQKMSPEPNSIFQDVIKIINHIKVHALNSDLFMQLYEERDAKHPFEPKESHLITMILILGLQIKFSAFGEFTNLEYTNENQLYHQTEPTLKGLWPIYPRNKGNSTEENQYITD